MGTWKKCNRIVSELLKIILKDSSDIEVLFSLRVRHVKVKSFDLSAFMALAHRTRYA